MKRLCSILLVLSLIITLAACDTGKGEQTPTDETIVLPTPVVTADIALPYTSAASFNPFKTKSSLNRDILPVIYESLFISTAQGDGIPVLAVSGKLEGKKVTVKLLQNALFSDGTAVLAKNVKSSFEEAKNSIYYSDQLENISGVTIIDNYTLEFNLYNPDAQALNALNFPVAKADGKGFLGTGKYSLATLGESVYLKVNKHHRNFSEKWNAQIALYDMAGITSPLYPFKANEISVYKNDLTEEYVNLSSKTVSVDTDNFVYIGVNSQWAGTITSIDWVRQAVNIGIDRKAITASSFLGQGTPTMTPFKAGFKELRDVDIIGVQGSIEKAIGILERNGYDKFNDDGIRTNGSNSLRVDILVCTKNQYKLTVAEGFKTALEKLGFGVTITKKKTLKSFKEALDTGHYSFYVGEAELTPNCELSEFFTESGSLNYGIDEEFRQTYSDYKSGEISTKAFVEGFSTEVPFLPLFYRKAVVSVNPNISGLDSTYGLYSSVSDWKLK